MRKITKIWAEFILKKEKLKGISPVNKPMIHPKKSGQMNTKMNQKKNHKDLCSLNCLPANKKTG